MNSLSLRASPDSGGIFEKLMTVLNDFIQKQKMEYN